MSKKALIDHISASTEISKANVESVLGALPEALMAVLQAEKRVEVPGVCILKKDHRAARKGRNPSTGAAIEIKAKDFIKYKSLSKFEEKL